MKIPCFIDPFPSFGEQHFQHSAAESREEHPRAAAFEFHLQQMQIRTMIGSGLLCPDLSRGSRQPAKCGFKQLD